jgi:hypothetical protein
MKIKNIKTTDDRTRIAATVIWEDRDKLAQDIYFATTQAFAEGLSANTDAYLVACIIPAMLHGQRRIGIDAEICAELCNGLITAMGLIRHYFGPAQASANQDKNKSPDADAVHPRVSWRIPLRRHQFSREPARHSY